VFGFLSQLAPFSPWVLRYPRRHLRGDLVAGLTVAVVAIPQSMAYALIAGLPVQQGLYASVVPTVAACLWGSSAHLVTGPTTAVSLVVFTTLSGVLAPGDPAWVEAALVLALLVGAIQAAMGFLRLGALLDYVSHSVIVGFSTGAAVLIGFKQLPNFFGLEAGRGGHFLKALAEMASALPRAHPETLLLGLLTVAVIAGVKKLRPAWPGTLFALILCGAAVALFDLDRRGVAVVGAIPQSLPPFRVPGVSWEEIPRLFPGALAIAVLGLVEAVSIAKAIASETRQRLNVDQEFIGQGMANLAAGLFSGYPGSGSFTRSAVNFRSGANTPLSGIVSAAAVGLTVLVAAPLAARIPIAALAGALLVVSVEMIHLREIRRIVAATRSDAAVLVATFLAVLLLSIEFAVFAGVLLSIALYLKTTSRPRIYSTVPDLVSGKMVRSSRGRICCQMDIVRIEGSLFFGSAAWVQEDLQRRLRSHRWMACLLLRLHQVNNLDASGVHVIDGIHEELRRRGGGIYFSGVNNRVFQVFKNSGLLGRVGDTHIRPSTGAAIRQAMRENFCPVVCAACEVAVFHECPELKRGRWEVLGKGARPRCALEAAAAAGMAPPAKEERA